MINFIAFDVDGTLRVPGKPFELEVVQMIHRLASSGVHISLVSGKDAVYLFGLAEGLGIPNPLVAGENGAVIFRPEEKLEIVYPVADETRRDLEFVKNYLWHEFRDSIWFPPNRAGVTAFTKPELAVKDVYKSAKDFVSEYRLSNLYVLPHWDAVDIMPRGLDKGVFIDYLKSIGFRSEEIVAVGDALNDIPMLKAVGVSITFKTSLPEVRNSADIVVGDIYEAFSVIEDLVKEGRRGR
ncbi:MAG: Cof-type HAD-IIB family hydrolase [Firmicutes bacterium]|nr:Cof-type HAD-IIB family hydrolase [Bacillota bacterium]